MTKTTFSLSIGLARLRMNAIRAVLVLLALAGGLPGLQTHSARAAVVFSTYVGGNCSCGLAGPDFLAAVPFTVGGSYDFAGAAAYMLNFGFRGKHVLDGSLCGVERRRSGSVPALDKRNADRAWTGPDRDAGQREL